MSFQHLNYPHANIIPFQTVCVTIQVSSPLNSSAPAALRKRFGVRRDVPGVA